MHIGEFHCSSIIGGLVIPQEGGEESGDKGELMRSCSRDTGTKVQPRAPISSSLFLVFLPLHLMKNVLATQEQKSSLPLRP